MIYMKKILWNIKLTNISLILKHIATDTYLLVQGRKNTALTIEQVMDGDIDWNNLTIIK
jgi:hypothetical protein